MNAAGSLRLVTPQGELLVALGQRGEAVLAGNAGTGKTTGVRALLERWQGEVLLLAPTAKAALRLSQVTGRAATTVHSVLYGAPIEQWIGPDGPCQGRRLPDGTQVMPPCRTACADCHCRQELVWPAPVEIADGVLVIVDEASMVGERLATDLRAEVFRNEGCLLWVGDPGQLPPVKETPGVHLHEPDVLLSKVHRSDRAGILRLSQEIRAASDGAELTRALRRAMAGGYDGVIRGLPGWQGVAGWRAGAAARMLITHRNRDRQHCNALVRASLGRTGVLQRGDRILIRKNVRGFVHNGEVHVVEAAEPLEVPIDHGELSERATFHRVTATLANVPRTFVLRSDLLATVDNDAFERERDISRSLARRVTYGEQLVNAQYGYTLTCHAAQGSEAEQVGVVWTHADVHAASQQRRFAYMRSWLYTAVTRARQALTLWVGP